MSIVDPTRLTREAIQRLKEGDPSQRGRVVEDLVPLALEAPRRQAEPALRALAALAPTPPPAALVEALGTLKSEKRLWNLCLAALECGPEGRNAVAALAEKPGRRGRLATSALAFAMQRPAIRPAVARRLMEVLARPEVHPARRFAAGLGLLEGSWLSARPLMGQDSGAPKKLRSRAREMEFSCWLPEVRAHLSWLDDFPSEAGLRWGDAVHASEAQAERESAEVERQVQARAEAAEQRRKEYARVGRNDACPCGSGKKFKKCCLSNEADPWGQAPASELHFILPFRVPPADHPEAAAMLAAMRGTKPGPEAGPAVVWASLFSDAAEKTGAGPGARRLLELRGRDPLFRDDDAAALVLEVLLSQQPLLVGPWLDSFARLADPLAVDAIARRLGESALPGKWMLHLGKALEEAACTDADAWRAVAGATVQRKVSNPHLLELLRRVARKLPAADGEDLLAALKGMEEPDRVPASLVEECDELERPLARLVHEALDRLEALPGRTLLQMLIHDALLDWAAELPTPEPLPPDAREPWAAEVQARLEALQEVLAPGGVLNPVG